MSIARDKTVDGRGGARINSGPHKGNGKKTKICVSVTDAVWQDALSIWRRRYRQGKPSWLVDELVSQYVETGGCSLEIEAAI
jgi:hypothetical protein